jgi:hypothetical protein
VDVTLVAGDDGVDLADGDDDDDEEAERRQVSQESI